MKPTLGVLITYYNERDLLRECLDSLVAGRDRPDEVVIYDDASVYPPEEYIPAGMNVQVLRGEDNGGPARARNRLLERSGSDYIHFQDADDLFHPDWVTRVRARIQETNPEAVFTEISSYRDGQKVCERVLKLSELSRGKDLVRFCLEGALLVPSGTYQRGKVLSIGGYREALWQSEDFDFHIRLANSGLRYEIMDEPLIRTRLRSTSRSQDQKSVWTSTLQALELLSKELPTEYRLDLAEKAAIAGSMLYQIHEKGAARRAFSCALQWGPPRYRTQGRLYGWVAGCAGPEFAERLGHVYRKVLPESVRRFIRLRD